jgi:hypothetical protein
MLGAVKLSGSGPEKRLISRYSWLKDGNVTSREGIVLEKELAARFIQRELENVMNGGIYAVTQQQQHG